MSTRIFRHLVLWLGLIALLANLAGCTVGQQQQVQALQERVAELDQQVSGLREENASLKQKVDDLQQQVSNLQGENDTLRQQVTALREQNVTLGQQNQALKDLVSPLPASLDNYFPPATEAPVFLFEMFALSGAFEGIIVDLQEQDFEGVQANYEAFKAQYSKVAEMVPEWKDRFPMEPVETLGQALASGDPAQVGPSLGQVGRVCSSCHLKSQVLAQQKYHWGDFGAVTLTDPVADEEVSFVEYMMRMAVAYSGIANDLRQGQLERARQQFDAFSARFKALPSGCENCHTTPRAYFVDESLQTMVDQLGEALAAETPDAQAIEQLSGAIGNESCLKCHMVHFPAAHTRARWDVFSDLFK